MVLQRSATPFSLRGYARTEALILHMEKRSLPSYLLLGLLAAFSLTSTQAHGATLNSQTFEGFSNGDLVGQGGWFQDIGTAAAFQVQNTLANTGSKALQVDQAGQPNFTRAIQFLSTAGSPVIVISMDFYVALASNTGQFRLTTFTTSNTAFADVIITSTGSTQLFNEAVNASVSAAAVTVNAWHSVQLSMDFNGRTMGVRFDDGPTTSLGMGVNSVNSLGAIAIMALPSGTGTSKMFVDNLEVASVPEPSTMVLLGLGLAAAAGLRRRRRG